MQDEGSNPSASTVGTMTEGSRRKVADTAAFRLQSSGLSISAATARAERPTPTSVALAKPVQSP